MQNFAIVDENLPEEKEEIEKYISEIESWVKSVYPQGGIIIIMQREDGGELFYWHENGYPISFSNDRVMQDPKLYKGFTHHLFKKITKLSEDYNNWLLFVGAWIHPDAGIPLEKYTKISGCKLPGSPRR